MVPIQLFSYKYDTRKFVLTISGTVNKQHLFVVVISRALPIICCIFCVVSASAVYLTQCTVMDSDYECRNVVRVERIVIGLFYGSANNYL
jgi:hypothetical protein